MLNLSLRAKVALSVALPTAGLLLYWLLKSDEEEDFNERNIATSKQTIIEVKVPKEYVGAVIGRGGTNIKDMSEKTGARIDFAPRSDQRANHEDFRIAKIRGSPAAAQKAELLVRRVIAESEKHAVRVTVRVRCLGRIIGRNGDTIRRIERVSGAKVKIDAHGDETNQNNEKGITIVGSLMQINSAKEMIEEKVREDDVFRAKVSLVSANRETRKRPDEDKLARHGPTAANGGGNSGIVSSHAVAINERWDIEMDPGRPRKPYSEVYISAIVHPGDFWVQIIDSRCIQFDELVGRMTAHYTTLARTNSTVGVPTSIAVGDVVAATFAHDDSWYRARVTAVADDNIGLFYVDYGDTGVVAPSDIRSLDDAYLGLPFQAIHCHLADVKPAGQAWTDEAYNDFEMLTHCAEWVVVMAQTVCYQSGDIDPIPCLHLVDTTGDEDIDINAEMVARGHAIPDTSLSNSNHDDALKNELKEENGSDRISRTIKNDTKTEPSIESMDKMYRGDVNEIRECTKIDDVVETCGYTESGDAADCVNKNGDVTQEFATKGDDVISNCVADDGDSAV